MGLRDIALLTVILGSIPFILARPFVGVLMWYWISLMNPHRVSWTLANLKVALLIGGLMIASLLFAKGEPKRIPWMPITVTLALFWLWMLITTIFSLYPQIAWQQWDKVWKIMLTTFIATMVLNSRPRIVALVVVIVLSIGFFGFKGGLFTVLHGGESRVWGPAGSFIADNNSMGLVLVMVLPLMFYLRAIATYRLVRLALLVLIILSAFAAVGTYSRGALLGLATMSLFLALKSRYKVQYLLLLVAMAPLLWTFMPESWHARMGTIETYDTDASAQGRIMAWRMAFNLSLHRITGGGFETFKPDVYLMYLPEVGPRRTDAHSNYFEVLGEHGVIGLTLFLIILGQTFFGCSRIIRAVRGRAELEWMRDLAAMIQVSIVGYSVCGLFLGMAYFDLYYALVAIVVGMLAILAADAKAGVPVRVAPLRPPPVRVPAGMPYVAPARPARPRLPFAPSPALAWQIIRNWYRQL